MTTPSGTISFQDLQDESGGTDPLNLHAYKKFTSDGNDNVKMSELRGVSRNTNFNQFAGVERTMGWYSTGIVAENGWTRWISADISTTYTNNGLCYLVGLGLGKLAEGNSDNFTADHGVDVWARYVTDAAPSGMSSVTMGGEKSYGPYTDHEGFNCPDGEVVTGIQVRSYFYRNGSNDNWGGVTTYLQAYVHTRPVIVGSVSEASEFLSTGSLSTDNGSDADPSQASGYYARARAHAETETSYYTIQQISFSDKIWNSQDDDDVRANSSIGISVYFRHTQITRSKIS